MVRTTFDINVFAAVWKSENLVTVTYSHLYDGNLLQWLSFTEM